MDFMGIAIKRIIPVQSERFSIPGKDDTPFEVRPVSLTMLKEMGDLSKKTMYIFSDYPNDVKLGIFKIYLAND